jgi:pimeloyl-ACP methyl ester carboxylesterase
MPTLRRPDGARIFYKVTGKDTGRPPLVFVHGWCSNHEIWRHQVRHFGKQHRLLLLDRRGQGRSTTSGAGHDPAGHAADIAAVTAATGFEGVVAIGHAGGSAGTMEFMRRNPSLARAGVIVDSYLYPQPRRDDPNSLFGSFFSGMIDTLHGPEAEKAFREWYTSYFDGTYDRATVERIVDAAAQTATSVKIAELEGLLVDTAAIARGITQPVLWLMAGMLQEAQDKAMIADNLKQVGFAQVYGAAHFPQFEQPAQTNAMIETFLARL